MAGLAATVEEFRHNSMIDVELQETGLTEEPTADATAHLLGIVHEALGNIARHSGASRGRDRRRRDPTTSLRADGRRQRSWVRPVVGRRRHRAPGPRQHALTCRRHRCDDDASTASVPEPRSASSCRHATTTDLPGDHRHDRPSRSTDRGPVDPGRRRSRGRSPGTVRDARPAAGVPGRRPRRARSPRRSRSPGASTRTWS